MLEPVVGLVPMDDLIAGLRVDALREHDPAGETIERLLAAVERHAAEEADALSQYDYLARASKDAVIALVMRLILADEERHHRLLKQIATTLRDALYWTESPEALPRTSSPVAAPAQDLAALALDLIDEERTGAAALRQLAVREKRLDSGLDSLLLEMMAMDSDKHARLLQFVQQRLQGLARDARSSPPNGGPP